MGAAIQGATSRLRPILMTSFAFIRKIPTNVPISIPPAAAVPMERLPKAPAPLATANGIKPLIKAKEEEYEF